jgi:hypothetical protein
MQAIWFDRIDPQNAVEAAQIHRNDHALPVGRAAEASVTLVPPP